MCIWNAVDSIGRFKQKACSNALLRGTLILITIARKHVLMFFICVKSHDRARMNLCHFMSLHTNSIIIKIFLTFRYEIVCRIIHVQRRIQRQRTGRHPPPPFEKFKGVFLKILTP